MEAAGATKKSSNLTARFKGKNGKSAGNGWVLYQFDD